MAAILPTLKVILLGGMQEPGHAAGSTLLGLLQSGQAADVAADPRGPRAGTPSRKACAGSRRSGRRPAAASSTSSSVGWRLPAGANLGLLVSSANRDEDVWGPTADVFDMFRPRRNHAAFGFGPHFCSGHHFSRVQMRIALQRLFERLPGHSARSRPAAGLSRLGVPGTAAPARHLGRVSP